jgi:hypothetical protein
MACKIATVSGEVDLHWTVLCEVQSHGRDSNRCMI